nr:MAG TPA: hypothetical protein [Caudoviricetes sp.]
MANATPSTYNYFTLTSLRHAQLIITISILQYHIIYEILKGVLMITNEYYH